MDGIQGFMENVLAKGRIGGSVKITDFDNNVEVILHIGKYSWGAASVSTKRIGLGERRKIDKFSNINRAVMFALFFLSTGEKDPVKILQRVKDLLQKEQILEAQTLIENYFKSDAYNT